MLIDFNFEESAMGGRGCLKAALDLSKLLAVSLLCMLSDWNAKKIKAYMYIY